MAMTFRTYEVTVTPKFKAYAGSWQSGSYTFEVRATDREHAIRQARSEYEDSRSNPATYRAKLVKGN